MKKADIQSIIGEIKQEVAVRIIQIMKNNKESTTSGSNFKSNWDRFKFFVQEEKLVSCEHFEQDVKSFITIELDKLFSGVLKLLWMETEHHFLFNQDIHPPRDMLLEVLRDELYKDIYEIANCEKLEGYLQNLKWYNFEIRTPVIPELQIVQQLNEFARKYLYSADLPILLPGKIRALDLRECCIPVSLSMSEIISGPQGSDTELVDEENTQTLFVDCIEKINEAGINSYEVKKFRLLFERELRDTFNTTLEEINFFETPEQRLYITYEIMAEVFNELFTNKNTYFTLSLV